MSPHQQNQPVLVRCRPHTWVAGTVVQGQDQPRSLDLVRIERVVPAADLAVGQVDLALPEADVERDAVGREVPAVEGQDCVIRAGSGI